MTSAGQMRKFLPPKNDSFKAIRILALALQLRAMLVAPTARTSSTSVCTTRPNTRSALIVANIGKNGDSCTSALLSTTALGRLPSSRPRPVASPQGVDDPWRYVFDMEIGDLPVADAFDSDRSMGLRVCPATRGKPATRLPIPKPAVQVVQKASMMMAPALRCPP
jgi:hypothetical protein